APKGTKGASSLASSRLAPFVTIWRAKSRRASWTYMVQHTKKAKYAPENWIDE
ncbi:hypothetical protein HAX54_001453, partial [Datura stramonium]|nr:hypothetical protein [Datura stramonium]